MTADDLTKALLSNKFKEFVELIEILRIETDSKTSDDEASNDKFNNDKTSDNDKNNEKFMTNYYKEADKAGKEADKKVSFETEKTE